jgi:hypothetical protein
MTTDTKTLIPEKEWILKNGSEKIGSIAKDKKGFVFLRKGSRIKFQTLNDIKTQFGIEIPAKIIKEKINKSTESNVIYDYPCSSKPFNPIYNIKKKLPLFAKSAKSKSQYCAGYYIIKFRKRWAKAFCPKLITLERYQYIGPVKTEQDMKQMLNNINKNESTKHYTD